MAYSIHRQASFWLHVSSILPDLWDSGPHTSLHLLASARHRLPKRSRFSTCPLRHATVELLGEPRTACHSFSQLSPRAIFSTTEPYIRLTGTLRVVGFRNLTRILVWALIHPETAELFKTHKLHFDSSNNQHHLAAAPQSDVNGKQKEKPKLPQHLQPSTIRGYVHTHRAERPLKLVYIDGMGRKKRQVEHWTHKSNFARGRRKEFNSAARLRGDLPRQIAQQDSCEMVLNLEDKYGRSSISFTEPNGATEKLVSGWLVPRTRVRSCTHSIS